MESVHQQGSILRRPSTPSKSPRRRAKKSPGIRKPLGHNPNPTRGNTPNANAVQGSLKPAMKQQPIEVTTKGILKDPKQNKRKRSLGTRRISFGSVEWSTFAKNDPITPTRNRAGPLEEGGMRESLDFNFDFNFDVDEDEDKTGNGIRSASGMDDFSVSSICPSEDDFSHSGVSMMEEQRPDAVSKWTSKASLLLREPNDAQSTDPTSPAPASTDVVNSPPAKKRDIRKSLDATLTNLPSSDQNEWEEEDQTDVIFSLVSFNRQDQGRQEGEGGEEEEEGEGEKTMDFTRPVGAGIKMANGSLDDKTEEFMKDFRGGADKQGEDEEDDQTDALFKVVSFGAPGNRGNTSIMHEKSMDMTQLHGGGIIDYRKEGGENEEGNAENESEPKRSDEEAECNDETMDFTTIVDRAPKESDPVKEMEENPFAKRDKISNSPPSVKVFLKEVERKDVASESEDEKTDAFFDMVSFGNRVEMEDEEAEEAGQEEEGRAGEGEQEEEGEDSISRMSLPSFSDSMLNGDDEDRTDTVFNVVSFGQGGAALEEGDGETSMVMGTEFVTPSRKPQKGNETPLKIFSGTPKRTLGTPRRTPARTPGRMPAGTPRRTPAGTPRRTPAGTPRRTPAGTPRRTPRRTPSSGTPRRAPRTPSSLSKEITNDTTSDQPAGLNPFAKSSLVQNSPIVSNSSFHNTSAHNNSLYNPSMAGQTDTEAEGEEATHTLFQLVSQPEGEKDAFEESEQPSPIHQQETSFANKSTARGVLLFGEDKTNEASPSPSLSSSVASPFTHRAINDNDYDPFSSSPLLPQTPPQEPHSAISTPLSAKQLNQHREEDSPNTSTYSSGRFSLENTSFALTEQDLVFSTDSPSPDHNNSLLDWDPSSPAPSSSSPSPSFPPSPSSPSPSFPSPSFPSPSPSPSLSSPSPFLAPPSSVAEKSIVQTPTSSSFALSTTPNATLASNTSLTATPTSKRENPFSEEVECSLRKLRICSKRLSDKISIHSTPITPRSRGPARSSLGGDSARANRSIPACEFMRLVGIGQDSSSNASFSKTPQRLSVMTPGGKRRKSNPNSRLTPRTMTRLTSKAGNWVSLMLEDSSQKEIPYQLVAAFAEGPHFDSLEKQLSETRKQTNDLQRRLQMLEQEIGNNNPQIFQELSKATGVKKSIMSDRLSRCYQKCLSQAKLEWLKQSASSRNHLQEELNNHREMIKQDLSTYEKHIQEIDSLQSPPPLPQSTAPPAPSTRDPSSLAENSIVPDENDHLMTDLPSESSNGGYSDPKKIEMWGKDMYHITAALQPWTLSSVTSSQLQFQFSSFCHVRVHFGGALADGGRAVTRTSIRLEQEKQHSVHPEPMEWVKTLVEASPAYRKWASLKNTKSLPSLLTLFSTTVRRATLLVKEIDSLRLHHHQPYILEISNNQLQQTSLPLLTKVTFLRKNEPYFSVLFALSSEYPFAPLHHRVLGLAPSSPLKSHVEDMIASVGHEESGAGYSPLSYVVKALAQFVGSQ